MAPMKPEIQTYIPLIGITSVHGEKFSLYIYKYIALKWEYLLLRLEWILIFKKYLYFSKLNF